MWPTQSGSAELTRWRDTQARYVFGQMGQPKKSVAKIRYQLGKVGEGHNQRGGVN